jgi:Ca2+-binding EF-hand superfamily protein
MNRKSISAAIAGLFFAGLAHAETSRSPADARSAEEAIKTEIVSTFAKIDTNKNGSLSREEFAAFTEQAIAQQIKVFNQTFDTLDINKDGKISKAEAAENKAFAAGFDDVDSDKNGYISKQELAMAMKAAQEDQSQN